MTQGQRNTNDKAELDRLAAERVAAVRTGLQAAFVRRRRGMPPADPSQHPANQMLLDKAPIGSLIADKVTNFLGSWTCIIIQTIIVAIWVAGNIYLVFHFDPYPFIFLNLAFSTQAAYAAPLILLASNRASVRDRMTLEHAALEADIEERQNEELLLGMTRILNRIESLEGRILELEGQIAKSLGIPTAPASAPAGSGSTPGGSGSGPAPEGPPAASR